MSVSEPGPMRSPASSDGDAILASLEGLLLALELEPVGPDRYRVRSEAGRFEQVFGGQMVAQALYAAGETVAGKDPNSLHAYFVEAGTPEEPLDLAVERVRDGRSISTRRVTVTQGDRTLLVAIASFHVNPSEVELPNESPVARAPDPENVPRLQDWARQVTPDLESRARRWIEQPPPIELRIAEPPTFLGGPGNQNARAHWMRVPRAVGADPRLHAALLAYSSDYLLLDMAFRAHPDGYTHSKFVGFSLDHSIWLHRPVRFDRWHLHTQEAIALVGHRGLVRGSISDADGRLVATVVQEVLVRPAR